MTLRTMLQKCEVHLPELAIKIHGVLRPGLRGSTRWWKIWIDIHSLRRFIWRTLPLVSDFSYHAIAESELDAAEVIRLGTSATTSSRRR